MTIFQEQKFNIGPLKGISQKTIDEHLKLYAGYVKNANAVVERISELSKDYDNNSYLIGELFRRFSFEYNGMRNHEVYFDSISEDARQISTESELRKEIEKMVPFDIWLGGFKKLALTRGVGWAILWWDRRDERLLASWVDEQHFGQLSDCVPILALDMWEHSYVADYQPFGKKQYIDDFFENLNWEKIEENFRKAKD
jgi:Fe-Mn family superoxide dismutase